MAAAGSPGSGGSIDLALRGSTVVITWGMAGFDEHLATNVRAPYFLTQAALPLLRESQVRPVVNIIDTPIHATWADDLDAAYRWLADQVPLGRIGDADEVARWIALLLSPVSSFMTGAVIPLDGGQVIR